MPVKMAWDGIRIQDPSASERFVLRFYLRWGAGAAAGVFCCGLAEVAQGGIHLADGLSRELLFPEREWRVYGGQCRRERLAARVAAEIPDGRIHCSQRADENGNDVGRSDVLAVLSD
jgi:hypothetical protein